jgi:hypothetical protein
MVEKKKKKGLVWPEVEQRCEILDSRANILFIFVYPFILLLVKMNQVQSSRSKNID